MARGNRGGGRGQGSPAPSQRGGGGRGGGEGGRGGRGSSNYRGRGRGGIWTDMSGAGLDYDRIDRERAERDKQREEAALNPPPPSASNPIPFAPSSTPNFPYQQSPYTPRGRGGFNGRGRGGRGGGPPPPMPFFINKSGGVGSTFRRSQEEDDAAYASASGSGAATPHFGIGAAKKVGLGGGGAQSSPSGRGGFGGRGGYVGSNALLKPVVFVKAGTLFKEGDVAVVVRDEAREEEENQGIAPAFHVEHYSLADAAVPQMVDPRHSIEVEIASLPSTSPASPDTFLPAESPAPSAIDEVEMALELMVVEDSTDEEQVELEQEEEENEQDETILPSNEDIEFASASTPVEIAPSVDIEAEPETQEEPSVAVEIEIDEVVVLVEEEVLEVELIEEDAPPANEPEPEQESLGFFIDVEPATPLPPISPAQEPFPESLGFFVDTTSSTASPSSNANATFANDIPSISYSHGTVLGDHIEVDAESDEEQIVWVPSTKKKNGPAPSSAFVAPPQAPFTFASTHQPSTPSANPLRPVTFNEYSPSFTTINTTSPGGSSRKPKLQTRPGKGKKAQKAAARRSRGGFEEEAPEPREGDSDVEWGSDGPPVSRGEGKSGWKAGGGGGGRGGRTGGRSNRDAELEAAILADYIENTRGSDGEQDDEGMEQFLEGTQSIEQVEVGDIVLERRRRDEERNDSDGDSDSSGGGSRDGLDGGLGEPGEDAGWATDDQDPDAAETKAGFGDAEEEMMAEESDLSASEEEDEEDDSDQAFLDALLAEDSDLLITDSDDDEEDDSEEEDLAEAIARSQSQRMGGGGGGGKKSVGGGGKKGGGGGKKGKGKGKGRMVESSSEEEDSEDEEDEMFQGNFSWADEDERFIQTLLDNNADIINGKDRSAQKKLFRAIERGDFDDYEEDFVVASPTSKRSKHIPAHLQSQWDLDRSKKADFKRARAEARMESLLDPFTSGSKNSRSNDRKGKKKGNVFSPDDPDSDQEMTSRAKGGGITDMVALDREIQGFLRDHGKTTMSLPPMEKESRKRVHLLAECYGLKSNSKGSGRKRFTILIKTSRTGVTPNRGKVARILNVQSDSAFYKASWSPRSGSGNHTMPGRGGGGGGPDASKRREGEVVGADSKMLGAENLGHRLLSKMGWSEGGKIGRGEGGLNVPIMATVKTSKLGLGHGL